MERIYISICNLFGAKIFKKYWVVGGSYWNNHHIDKDNKYDVQNVITDSWEYSKQHIGALFVEVLLFGMMMFLNINPEQPLSNRIFLIPLMFHGYPLMIHQYNRIIARRRIEYLDLIQQSVMPQNIIQCEEAKTQNIMVDSSNPYGCFDVKLNSDYRLLGPRFSSKEKANEYVDFLSLKYTIDDINEKLFLESENELYLEFKRYKTDEFQVD